MFAVLPVPKQYPSNRKGSSLCDDGAWMQHFVGLGLIVDSLVGVGVAVSIEELPVPPRL